jgi:DNA primase small subunit
MVKYLNINDDKWHTLTPLGQKMLDTCESLFQRILAHQPVFTSQRLRAKLREFGGELTLKWIDEELKRYNIKDERPERAGIQKWNYLKGLKYNPSNEGGTRLFGQTEPYWRIVFGFTVPKLDANVTTILNHLLKSPFSYHPKSGLISVPMNRGRWVTFPRDWVPSLKDLVQDGPGHEEAVNVFNNCVREFEEFVEGVVNEQVGESNSL